MPHMTVSQFYEDFREWCLIEKDYVLPDTETLKRKYKEKDAVARLILEKTTIEWKKLCHI